MGTIDTIARPQPEVAPDRRVDRGYLRQFHAIERRVWWLW